MRQKTIIVLAASALVAVASRSDREEEVLSDDLFDPLRSPEPLTIDLKRPRNSEDYQIYYMARKPRRGERDWEVSANRPKPRKKGKRR